MAKYNLSSRGRQLVDCDILNESAGRYVVRFPNGSVTTVDKNRVHYLNEMDNEVLDRIRNKAKAAGETISKYGKRIARGVKDVARAVKEFFVKAFKMNGFVFFKNDENGDVLNASHPINAMIAAKSNKSINVIPSDDTIGLCREMGIEARGIENFDYEGEYEGALQPDEPVYENVSSKRKYKGSALDMLSEREGDYVDSKPIDPRSPKISGKNESRYKDFQQDDIIEMILEEYEMRKNGENPKSLPYFIWGAPGVGKTQIISGLVDIIKEQTGVKPGMIAINARTIGPDSFQFPAQTEKEVFDDEELERRRSKWRKEHDNTEEFDFLAAARKGMAVIKDLPKDWMPVYDPHDPRGDEFVEEARKIANGGKRDENGKLQDGPGGIIFIDEYARMTDDAIASLMQLPASRYFNSESQTLGDRWVIVAAANRKEDLGSRANVDFRAQDAAMNTRWQLVNFVPTFNDWKKWAVQKRKGNTEQQNVHPDILVYVENSIAEGSAFGDAFGDFYNMGNVSSGYTNTAEARACPRTWESFSGVYYNLINKYGSAAQIPEDKLLGRAEINVGRPVAKRFVEAMKKFKFTNEDARALWAKGRTVTPESDLKQYLNTGNFENFMMNFVFPKLDEEYPNATNQNGISEENLLNVINWIERIAPTKTGGNKRLDPGILRKIFKVFGTDIAGVELIDFENDGSEDLYATAKNRVTDILMSNDSAI